jgi:uncharacterized protein (TIGR00251 family)
MKITETKEGTLIEVFVKPNSPKFEITLENEEIVLRCTEEPVKGKVNKELVKELSKFFQVKVELVSGFTSKQKRFILKRFQKDDVESILRNKCNFG